MNNQKTIGVDIGNSAIKTAEFFATEVKEIRIWEDLDQVISAYPEAHFIVSSVGISEKEIKPKLKSFTMVNSRMALPISLNYESTETLGSDRIAAAAGAWDLFPNTNLLVIDAGTCVTYDLITSDGVFQGGMISPGFNIRLQAMHQFTNGLPLVDPEQDLNSTDIVRKSTKECVWQGAKSGLSFEIEGVLESFNKKYDRLQVVITGGLMLDFESTTKAHIFANSKIVLNGLHAIWKFNESI
ncbi:MAG: type III pantothenate kinase [Cytophagales bacterium]|nr:type III pantothenate kinase [Cytophagales bacterium]